MGYWVDKMHDIYDYTILVVLLSYLVALEKDQSVYKLMND